MVCVSRHFRSLFKIEVIRTSLSPFYTLPPHYNNFHPSQRMDLTQFIPRDVKKYIFSFCDIYIPIVARVCKEWKDLLISSNQNINIGTNINGYQCKLIHTDDLPKECIERGYYNLLAYLYNRYYFSISSGAYKHALDFRRDSIVYGMMTVCKEYDYRHIRIPALYGNFELVKKMYEECILKHAYSHYDLVKNSLRSGNIKLIKLIEDIFTIEEVFRIDRGCIEPAITIAAEYGNYETVMYLIKRGYKMEESACKKASMNGHLDLLMLLRRYKCPWDSKTCNSAINSENLDIYQWAIENGCPVDKTTSSCAAAKGYLDILSSLHQSNCPWDKETCISAASKGELDCFIYAVENGCECDETAYLNAAHEGQFHILKWAVVHNGYRIPPYIFKIVILHQAWDEIKWFIQHGCEWNDHVCSFAIWKKRVDIIECAVKLGHRISTDNILQAIKMDSLEILKLAVESGCEWNPMLCNTAAEEGNIDIVRWIIEYPLEYTMTPKISELMSTYKRVTCEEEIYTDNQSNKRRK